MSEMSAWARSIGHKIRQCRIALNLTQEDLADGIFSKSYISQLERGTVTPSLRALRLLAGRLGVSCTWLLESGSSPPSLLIAAATTNFYVGETDEARRLLREAQAHRDAFSQRDHIEALLLEARLLASRREWTDVIDVCTNLDDRLKAVDTVPQRYAVSQKYLWGNAWYNLGNLRQAIQVWEAGLSALNQWGGPPTHEGLLLLAQVSDLYEQLGDHESAQSMRARALAAATQILSIDDLSRWVLARTYDDPVDALTPSLTMDRAQDLVDAEAWARASVLLSTAKTMRTKLARRVDRPEG